MFISCVEATVVTPVCEGNKKRVAVLLNVLRQCSTKCDQSASCQRNIVSVFEFYISLFDVSEHMNLCLYDEDLINRSLRTGTKCVTDRFFRRLLLNMNTQNILVMLRSFGLAK